LGNQKDAEHNAAMKILSTLPVRKIDDSVILQRGSAHDISFQAAISVPGPGESMEEFSSEWMKKKLEAKRELLQKVVEHYFLENGANPPCDEAMLPKSSAEHYASNRDGSIEKVRSHILSWQRKNLDEIKQVVGPLPEPQPVALDGLLTVAFVHSSFSHTIELQEDMLALGLPYPNYERLEFFGDAVLGFVVSKMLFQANQTDTPHDLTVKRSNLVREDSCCSYMKKSKLDQFVIHRDVLQTPSAKILCDVFEAIVGALYCAYEEDAQPLITKFLRMGQE